MKLSKYFDTRDFKVDYANPQYKHPSRSKQWEALALTREVNQESSKTNKYGWLKASYYSTCQMRHTQFKEKSYQ